MPTVCDEAEFQDNVAAIFEEAETVLLIQPFWNGLRMTALEMIQLRLQTGDVR